MTKVIPGVAGLKALIGQPLGVSDWLEITQEMVNDFAEVTGDRQWIHVDVERATSEGPFGGPIVHGFYTLSLGPRFMPTIATFDGFIAMLNYGLDTVRFLKPVLVGKRVRLNIVEVKSVEDRPDGSSKATLAFVFEIEGEDKPACVVDMIVLCM